MILTVHLNPAVDRNGYLESLRPGQVNRLQESAGSAGGKAVNVAKVLRQFHIPVAAAGFLGGSTGQLIEESLEKAGVACHFTRIAGTTRTNVNIRTADGAVTELLEPGPVISEKELLDFRNRFLGCLEFCNLAVLSGSLPGGVPATIYRELTEACHMAGLRVILDASGEALREGLKAAPDVIKPNREELEQLTGQSLPGRAEAEEAAAGLLGTGVGQIVVSLGEEGLLYLDSRRRIYQPARQVRAVNTVGCGDTAVASLCMSLLAEEEPELALRKAAALAAANAVTAENGLISMETYLNLL